MKKIISSLVALLFAFTAVFAQGKADFATLAANTSYLSGKTDAGWAYANSAVFADQEIVVCSAKTEQITNIDNTNEEIIFFISICV